MKINRDEVLQKAVDAWGADGQSDMCIEECSELIKALLKYRRALYRGRSPVADAISEAVAHIREEVADVQIMLDQMRLLYGSTEKEEVFKVERLAARLGICQKGKENE